MKGYLYKFHLHMSGSFPLFWNFIFTLISLALVNFRKIKYLFAVIKKNILEEHRKRGKNIRKMSNFENKINRQTLLYAKRVFLWMSRIISFYLDFKKNIHFSGEKCHIFLEFWEIWSISSWCFKFPSTLYLISYL